jgi:ubiquitin
MLKDCSKSQGYRLKTVSRKKSNTNIGSDTLYNAEIAVEGDLKTQIVGVLKNKISTPQTSNLAETFLIMYRRFVPNGKIIG